MAALSAAEIENAVGFFQADRIDGHIHIGSGIFIVFDNVAIGPQINRVKKRSPPFGRQMAFQV